VKLVKLHTDQEHSQSLEILPLMSQSHIPQTVQLEKLQQVKHSRIQHVLLLTQIIQLLPQNVFQIFRHVQIKVLEWVNLHEPVR
jgi:hypothetical protein